MIEFAATFPTTTENADVLAPIIRHMIEEAERWLGPAFDPPVLDTVFVHEGCRRSCVRYSSNRSGARIELASRVQSDPRWLAYELAHECIHLFAPGPTNRCATNLEEGLAVEFSMRYAAERFGTDGWLFANDRNLTWEYLAAWTAARRLLSTDDAIIRRIRGRQPVLSYISADLIREFAPGCSARDAKFLARPFVGTIETPG